MIGCSDLITWGIQLARIPRHRFRRAGKVVRSIGRFGRLGKLARGSRSGGYSSASSGDHDDGKAEPGFFSGLQKKNKHEVTTSKAGVQKGVIDFKCVDADRNRFPISIVLSPDPVVTTRSPWSINPKPVEDLPITNPTTPTKRKRGCSTTSSMAWATSLTHAQAKRRKYAYAVTVYAVILSLIFFGIRPYLSSNAFNGIDPFPWAASYLFCALPGYSSITVTVSSWLGYQFAPGENWTGCLVWYNSQWSDYSSIASTSSSPGAAEATRRLYISCYWLFILSIGITLVLSISKRLEVDTRRKLFHGMVVGMFLLAGVIDPMFTHLAMSLVLAIFLIADLVRAGQLPPVSRPLSEFLAPFVDGRDLKGPVVVSHFFLLVGGAVGVWFSVAAAHATAEAGNWDEVVGTSAPIPPSAVTRAKELAFVAGVICVGLGDSAASIIGRRFGRRKWGWSGGKSLEGSLAFMVAVGMGLCVARWWLERLSAGSTGSAGWGWSVWGKIWGSAAGAAMLEAVVTGGNDNVVVPVGMWCVVRGVGL